MADIYYGNGECRLEASNIRGVEIHYEGKIMLKSTAGVNFVVSHGNGIILIYPNGQGFLTDLFKYSGTMKIVSVTLADNDANRVVCAIKRVMDYSELLQTNAEDMTNLSENLNKTYTDFSNTIVENNVIEDQHTGKYENGFEVEDGQAYIGDFHIHTHPYKIMTGSKHTPSSQLLSIVVNQDIINERKQFARAKRKSFRLGNKVSISSKRRGRAMRKTPTGGGRGGGSGGGGGY